MDNVELMPPYVRDVEVPITEAMQIPKGCVILNTSLTQKGVVQGNPVYAYRLLVLVQPEDNIKPAGGSLRPLPGPRGA